jgi:hypothetical protein
MQSRHTREPKVSSTPRLCGLTAEVLEYWVARSSRAMTSKKTGAITRTGFFVVTN